MSAKEAQDIAYEKGMDLVKIAPQAKPPVCKIMDYGKYKFERVLHILLAQSLTLKSEDLVDIHLMTHNRVI